MAKDKFFKNIAIINGDSIIGIPVYSNSYKKRNKYIFDLSRLGADFCTAARLSELRTKIYGLNSVLHTELEMPCKIEAILMSGEDFDNNFGTTTNGEAIRQRIQDEFDDFLSTKAADPTPISSTFSAVDDDTKDLQPYYVLPKTGIQVYQDQKAPHRNSFYFSIAKNPYYRMAITATEIGDFVREMNDSIPHVRNAIMLVSDSDTKDFKPDSLTIRFGIGSGNLSNSDIQEKCFGYIDNALIKELLIRDYSIDNSVNQQRVQVTLADIEALKAGDVVNVIMRNTGSRAVYGDITLFIKGDILIDGFEAGKLADMRDNIEGLEKKDLNYGLDWFLQPEFDIEIIRAGGKPDIDTTSVSTDTVSNVSDTYAIELEIAKKELGQLMVLRSFLSPIAFEKKIEINQRIAVVQKNINDLNFKIIERNSKRDDIFEDLFEQSFTPIQNDYGGIFNKPKNDDEANAVNFFCPDGTPSKLSDSLNELIRTPQFMEWFGNWQLAFAYKDISPLEIPCSRVMTKHYEPRVVWHGTGSEFSYFRFESFPAAYFAVNYNYSKWFADLHGGENGYTIPFFLNIRNPLDLTKFGTRKTKPKEFFDYIFLMTGMTMTDLEVNPIFMNPDVPANETWVYLRNNPKMIKKLSESHTFDGIHFFETNPSVPQGENNHSTEAYIVFRADQCKIADPERGVMLFASLKSFLLRRGGKI
jgi:hypothetical protein